MTQTFTRRPPVDAPVLNGQAPIRRQRKWSLALVAVLLTVGSALAFAVLWMNAGERKPFLAVGREVPAGQVITADDLTVVRAAVDGSLAPIPADERADVVGQSAQTDLVPGTLLTEANLGQGSFLDTGQAVVGLSLRGGQIPTASLRAGDRVLVIQTAAAGGADDDGALGAELVEARVYDMGLADPTTGEVVVSLVVDEGSAAEVAGAAAAKLASLVLVPAGGDS